MSVLGWFAAICGVVGVIVALRLRARMKKMETVPFRTPSEIAHGGASVADEKGMISTEGEVHAGALLVAPMSGQQCLAYKVVVKRKWEKDKETENGTKTESGSEEIHAAYAGSKFQLTDGSGGIVNLDLSKEPDADFVKGHSSTVKVGMSLPSSLTFGQMQMNAPRVSHDSRTVGYEGTETILKADGRLYAMGSLKGGTIGTPDGLLGKLLLSTKGREALLGSTRRNMQLGFAIGGFLFVGGTALGMFGPKPVEGPRCANLSGPAACTGKIMDSSGVDVAWTVPATGTYHVAIAQPNVKRPIDAVLTITDASGKQVAFNDDDGQGSTDAAVEQEFQAGTYKINVRDFAKRKVSGGYSYALAITPVAAPMPVAQPEPVAPAEPAPAHAHAHKNGSSRHGRRQ